MKDIVDVRGVVTNQPYHRSLAVHTRLGKVDAIGSDVLGHARVITLWIEIRGVSLPDHNCHCQENNQHVVCKNKRTLVPEKQDFLPL